VREWVSRVEGQGGQGGQDLALEVPAQELDLLALELGVVEDPHLLSAQRGQELLVPAPARLVEHRLQLLAETRQLLRRRHAVGRRLEGACLELVAQAGDPDHEELVQVAGEDRQELDPLDRLLVRVQRLLEHAPVELEPAQLAIDVVLATSQVARRPGWPFLLPRALLGWCFLERFHMISPTSQCSKGATLHNVWPAARRYPASLRATHCEEWRLRRLDRIAEAPPCRPTVPAWHSLPVPRNSPRLGRVALSESLGAEHCNRDAISGTVRRVTDGLVTNRGGFT